MKPLKTLSKFEKFPGYSIPICNITFSRIDNNQIIIIFYIPAKAWALFLIGRFVILKGMSSSKLNSDLLNVNDILIIVKYSVYRDRFKTQLLLTVLNFTTSKSNPE